MPSINFFEEDITFKFPQKIITKTWIKNAVQKEGSKIQELNFIFCSDLYLKQVNLEYLQHDYFTDIITFDNSEEAGFLEGDIFISIDRVRDNNLSFGTSFEEELRRVIIHGVLHLLGYADKSEADQKLMRQKENEHLSLYLQTNQK